MFIAAGLPNGAPFRNGSADGTHLPLFTTRTFITNIICVYIRRVIEFYCSECSQYILMNKTDDSNGMNVEMLRAPICYYSIIPKIEYYILRNMRRW